MSKRVYGWKNERMVGRVDERMDGWKDEKRSGVTALSLRVMNSCVYNMLQNSGDQVHKPLLVCLPDFSAALRIIPLCVCTYMYRYVVELCMSLNEDNVVRVCVY